MHKITEGFLAQAGKPLLCGFQQVLIANRFAPGLWRANLKGEVMSTHEPCPVCDAVGGYCGGSGHPSCGAFHNGYAVSQAEWLALQEAAALQKAAEPKAG